jgi:hypothetical protein
VLIYLYSTLRRSKITQDLLCRVYRIGPPKETVAKDCWVRDAARNSKHLHCLHCSEGEDPVDAEGVGLLDTEDGMGPVYPSAKPKSCSMSGHLPATVVYPSPRRMSPWT